MFVWNLLCMYFNIIKQYEYHCEMYELHYYLLYYVSTLLSLLIYLCLTVIKL